MPCTTTHRSALPSPCLADTMKWIGLLIVVQVHAGLPAAPAISNQLSGPKQAIRSPSDSTRHFVASALSGALGVTALAPIEVMRISLMLRKDQSFRGAVRSLGAGGGWFRGNSADTLAAALKVGVTMPMYSFFKDALTHIVRKNSNLAEDAPAPQWTIFLAGALAGTAATVVAFPLDVVRTRLAMECPVDMNVATCLILISEEEGLRALYRGLVRLIPRQ